MRCLSIEKQILPHSRFDSSIHDENHVHRVFVDTTIGVPKRTKHASDWPRRRSARVKQKRRERLVTRSFGRKMAAVEGDRFDLRNAEVSVLRGVERVARPGGQMRIADPADGQMTIPAPILVREAALDGGSLD